MKFPIVLFILISLSTLVFSETLEFKAIGFNPITILNVSDEASVGSFNKNDSSSSEYVLLSIQSSILENNQLSTLGTDDLMLDSDSDVEAAVNGPALFYPNPFSLSEGSVFRYFLSKNMPIEIRLYDMRGNEIYKNDFSYGLPGGKEGLNTIEMNAAAFNNFELSAGIYFFVILNDGDILKKGKFAIKP